MLASTIHACFDFRLRSQIPLGELNPAAEAAPERPLVEVRLGALPAALPGAAADAYGLQVAGRDALLTVPGVGRYLVRDGREIVVDPHPGAAERNVRLFLLGSALGIVLHMRGVLPLHANAVVIDGAAHAFAGPSGAGKSTLAAHFAGQGHEVLCDDVCVVDFAGGAPMAWPGLPRVKLWQDAADAFGHDTAQLERAVEGLDKFQLPIGATERPGPVPLKRLYLLARADDGQPSTIQRLRGQAAMHAVLSQTYRDIYLAPLGLQARNFRLCAALLEHVEVYQARRAWGFDRFAPEAAALERHISGGQG